MRSSSRERDRAEEPRREGRYVHGIQGFHAARDVLLHGGLPGWVEGCNTLFLSKINSGLYAYNKCSSDG